MEDSNPASPASSSASDSDAYNTESARIYFGPLKTPERNFVASSKHLSNLSSDSSPLRRSHRLSTSHTQVATTSLVGSDAVAQDAEDMELVAQLVNEVEVDDCDDAEEEMGEMAVSLSGTPQKDLSEPDEPSSALADRILHATDNPSPPPSPSIPLSIFDPYHSAMDPSTDYQHDLISLDYNNPPLNHEQVQPSGIAPTSLFTVPSPVSAMELSPPQGDLISFDTSPRTSFSDAVAQLAQPHPQQVKSVDDLLTQSPDTQMSNHEPFIAAPASVLVVEDSGQGIVADDEAMAVDTLVKSRQPLLHFPDGSCDQSTLAVNPPPAQIEDILLTPLRRSTRPRRSVSPNPRPSPGPPQVFFPPPPSSARTTVKKKGADNVSGEDIVDDSEDEREEIRQSPTRMTPIPNRVRQRSPGKEPIPFHRQLGSLSPDSANLLSNLEGTGFGAPATPVGPVGPRRIASPVRAEMSPSKFRIQVPTSNDAPNTPARRMPMEDAILTGHISPEKAALLGFKPTASSSTLVQTPARRILISETQPAPATSTKPTALRFGSPAKQPTTSQRDKPAGTSYRLLSYPTAKGKEKATALPAVAPPVVKPGNLPFPLSASGAVVQDNTAKAHVTPVKSNLRQPTSRIPRIGTKPYARTQDKPGAKSATTGRLLDVPKSVQPATNVRKSTRIPEAPKSTNTSSLSRIKPTVSTSATLLKRKRDADKSLPVKPNVVMIRQVPPVATQAFASASTQTQPASASAVKVGRKGLNASQNVQHIRRVVSPEPAPSPIVEDVAVCVPEEGATMSGRSGPPAIEPAVSPPPSLPPIEKDLPPGSPMKQDVQTPRYTVVVEIPPSSLKSMSAPIITVTEPPPTIPEPASESSASGLRRTTRSRRNAAQEGQAEASTSVWTPNPRAARRKAASSYHSDDVFSGMSITALKDLTTSNTVKNQRYLTAKLELEVVRKEGLRPESPAVKIKTISQKQQDGKEKSRGERAKRRAARLSGDQMDGSSDMEASSDVGYSSPAEDEDGDTYMNGEEATKHQRGAGEDEDYVTPERRRGLKAMLFDDGSGPEKIEARRVKWDRGLFTLVYLDEVKLGTRQPLKENRALKGILAPTAKALRLDTLGNLPHTESPLSDLVSENVTVKKFVYDDDAPPPPPAPVVKTTRAKSKRK